MNSGKKRAPNFCLREKELLISLVKKYFHILENKKTNAVFNKQKAQFWEKLAWEYNAHQTTGPRTGVQLKSMYEQLKKLAKQHAAEDKVEVLKTGGGIFIPKVTTLDDKILILLKDNYFFIDNQFDSNTSVEQHSEDVTTSLVQLGKKQSTENSLLVQPSTSFSYNDISNKNNILVVYEDSEDQDQNESYTLDEMCANEPNINNSENEVTLKTSNDMEHKDKVRTNKNEFTPSITTDTIEDMDIYTDNTTVPSLLTPRNVSSPKNRGSKRKFQLLTNTKKKNDKSSFNDIIQQKKLQLLEKKNCILDTVQKVEEENLKGKILDNEIKQIIKEREMIELKAKKHQYRNISDQSD